MQALRWFACTNAYDEYIHRQTFRNLAKYIQRQNVPNPLAKPFPFRLPLAADREFWLAAEKEPRSRFTSSPGLSNYRRVLGPGNAEIWRAAVNSCRIKNVTHLFVGASL